MSISFQEQAIAKGIKPTKASLLLSSAGVGSLIGRVSMGFVCDKVTNNFGKEKIVFTIIVGNIINGSGNLRRNKKKNRLKISKLYHN